MRVALCISGQPRCVQRGYEHIKKNIIDFNGNVDVFFHTWFDPSVVGKRFMQAAQMHVASEPISAETPQILDDLYKPSKRVVEPQRDFDVKDYANRKLQFINVFYQLSALYSLMVVNDLKKQYEMEHGFVYDSVIRIRFDFGIRAPIFMEAHSMDKVYAPNNCPHVRGINDQFAFSSSHNMDIYADLFNKVETYYRTSDVVFAGECLVYHNLVQQNIPIEAISVDYDLLRG